MSQFLVICATIALIFVQLVQGQLVPLPTLPPITIPPITIPPITIPPVGVVVPVLPTVCPAGYFANLLLCYPCPAGTTSASGDLTCSTCATGFYAPGPGSSACTACAAGYTSSAAYDSCVCGGSTKGKGTTKVTKGKTSSTAGVPVSSTQAPILVTIPPITVSPITIPPITIAPVVVAPVSPIVTASTAKPTKATKGKGKGKGKE